LTGPIAALLALLIAVSPASYAQESAQSVVSIERQEAVQISGIDDWDFGSWAVHDTANRAVRLRDTTCVHSSTGSYSLTLGSLNGTNRLRLMSGDGSRIRYNIVVRYQDGAALTNQRVRQSGTTINNMTGSLTLDCTGARNWNLRFTPIVNRNQFNRAPPGIYQDVVTLLVTPE
jgi:spore coat protein U-like protein